MNFFSNPVQPISHLSVALDLVSGSDLWLNTPQSSYEDSRTSGMKAAFNGVPCLSILDGWWVEGYIKRVTGWAIGKDGSGITNHDSANSL